MNEPRLDCARFADDLVELALGTIAGRARADLIAHVADCPHCSSELEALSGATDRLLQLVPEKEPPLGFEVRVLTRIRELRRARLASWRRRTAVLITAAAVVAGVVGFVAGHGFGSARPPRAANEVTAVIHTASRAVGELSVPTGRTPRLVVKITGLGTNGPVTCRVTGTNGRTATIGVFWLYHGSGSWTAALPFPVKDLRGATITAANGSVLARASVG
ncbi:MAG: anti-sigma factor family protein [Acidimicrobiales bacterium]